jgi:lamin tail-like protein
MRTRSAVMIIAAVAGMATFASALPATAAGSAPTISAPTSRTGFGPIAITGTAPAGATVTLIEAAYIFRGDMNPATDYDTGGIVTATADSSGHYTIERYLDSGFVFATEAGGLRSPVITVSIRVLPTLTITPAGSGTLNVSVAADPGQPGLPVEVQRRNGTSWTVVDSGFTDQHAVFETTLTGQGTTTQLYRAYIGADTLNAVLANYSQTVDSTGTVVAGPTPTPPPAPKPTPKPTAPAPVVPRAGEIQFSKIVYDAPGTDTTSNTSLNGEYFRLTNKGSRTLDLKNWTVRDAAGHSYTFTGSYSLRAGKSVYVHTGKGTNGKPDSTHRYWGRTMHIWNNGGDTAALRSNAGKTIDSCKYGKGGGTTYC